MTDKLLTSALECLTTLCEWFSQREARKPTTNSEAAMFDRASYVAAQIEAACDLGLDAHKVMTFDEYVVKPIKGWHSVCRDYDGFGAIAVRYDEALRRGDGEYTRHD